MKKRRDPGNEIAPMGQIESTNRSRSIYRYSNVVSRLSGQTSLFGIAFFIFLYPSLFWVLRDKINFENVQFCPESLGKY